MRQLTIAALFAFFPLAAGAQMSLPAAIKQSVKKNRPVLCYVIYTGTGIQTMKLQNVNRALDQKSRDIILEGNYLVAKQSFTYSVNLVTSVPVQRLGKQGVSYFVPGGTAKIYNLDVGLNLTGAAFADKIRQGIREGHEKVKAWMKRQKELLEKHELESTTAKELKTNYDALFDLSKHASKGYAAGVVYSYCDIALKMTKKDKELKKEDKDKRTEDLYMLKASAASRALDYKNAVKYFGTVWKSFPKSRNAGPAAIAQAETYKAMGNTSAAIGVLNRVIRTGHWTRVQDKAARLLKKWQKK